MKKLFKLKQWLTIDEAATHLSIIFSEPVTKADVFRLSLDGLLKLSVNFVNHAKAKTGKVIPISEASFYESTFPGLGEEAPVKVLNGIFINDSKVFEFNERRVITIEGIWDLPMIGAERLDIEHEYQSLTGGPEITLQDLDGAFVENQDGLMCQLQESFDYDEYRPGILPKLEMLKEHIASNNIGKEHEEKLLKKYKEDKVKFLGKQRSRPDSSYYPASSLPLDSVLVVRTDALRDLEQLISENDLDRRRPHGNTEKNAQKREQVLGAALSVLANYPEQCKNKADKLEATKIRTLIEEKALLFWPETGEPVLSTDKTERLIREWIKKLVSKF